MNLKRLGAAFLLTAISGCIPSWAVQRDTENFERAKQEGNYTRLVQICVKPEKYQIIGKYYDSVGDLQEQACAESKRLLQKSQKERLEMAVAKKNSATLQSMCAQSETIEGFTPEQLGLVPTQQQACTELKNLSAAELAQVTQESQALGGFACLAKLDGYFLDLKKSKRWLSETKTDDAQRALLTPTADSCLAQVETQQKEGKSRELYRQTTSLKMTTTGVLTPAQAQRVGTVVTALPPAIATEYETEAAAQSAEPAAAALYWASGARMAQIAHDAARQKKDLTEAKAALAKANIKESLTVSMSGDGLASEIVTKLKSDGLGSGLKWADANADLPISVGLSSPVFAGDKQSVMLKTEVKEQKGTQIRHEWAEKKKDCDREQRQVDEGVESCRKHGPRNVNCGRYESNKKDVKWCLEKLERIKKEEPAFAMVDVPYEGTKYSGTLSGSLKFKQGAESPMEQVISVSEERTGHGFVERAKLASVSVKPPTAADLRSSYFASATAAVYSKLRKVADARASGYLDSALKATTVPSMAADAVRFAVVGRMPPTGKVATVLDEKLNLPASEALTLLLSSN